MARRPYVFENVSILYGSTSQSDVPTCGTYNQTDYNMDQYRKTPRAKFLDYNGGDYFITICTQNRKHYFGEIYCDRMHLSSIGEFVEMQLSSASHFSKDIDVPLFVVMPNHIHAIVSVSGKEIHAIFNNGDIDQRCPNPSLRANPTGQRHIPVLSRYISSFKGAVTKFARVHDFEFNWQSRYHDHFIRGSYDGKRIAEYIMNNVANWQKDCFNHEIQI